MPEQQYDNFSNNLIDCLPSTKKLSVTDDDWNKAIHILHRYKQNDFSTIYKLNTFKQSITHRFLLTDLDTFDDYLQLLENSTVEKDLLYDLLIPTRSQFFLNPEAWQSLKKSVIPQLMAVEPPTKVINCWVAGCGTGEEAYSLAMLLNETILAKTPDRKVKIIATDVSSAALQTSVKGIYHQSLDKGLARMCLASGAVGGTELLIGDVLGQERLKQYFIKQDNNFLVNHKLRKLVSFAFHNLIKPIGFTNMDLICCRNTLAYFKPQYKNQALETLTSSLSPQGFLFLGNNELLEKNDAFNRIDSPGIIFQKRISSEPSTAKDKQFFSRITINEFQLQYSKINSAIYKLRDLESELESTQMNLQSSAAALRSDSSIVSEEDGEGAAFGATSPNGLAPEWGQNAERSCRPKGRLDKQSFSQKLQHESTIIEEIDREVTTANTNIRKINQELYSINQARSSQIEILKGLNSDLENLLCSIDIGVIFLDRQLKIHKYNSSAQKIINFRATDIGRPIKDLKHNLDCSNLVEILEQFLQTKCPEKLEVKNNQTKEILLMKLHYYCVDSQPRDDLRTESTTQTCQGVILTFVDISDRKQAEQTLSYQAFYDSLTRLPNRLLFKEKLQHALHRLSRQQSDFLAVLYLDLNGFKEVNDSLGHSAGDLLLIEAGHRLNEAVRSNDVVSRLGGDEFAILLEEIYSPEQCLEIASRIHQALARCFSIESRQVTISTSIGIAIHSQKDDLSGSIETLMENADMAMYRAKRKGMAYAKRYPLGETEIFSSQMRSQAETTMKLKNQLSLAFEQEEFVLHYQPVFGLKDGTLQGFEALVRWLHPGQSIIYPDAFLPLIQDSSLLFQLERWIIKQACEQLYQWQEQFEISPDFSLSINISPPLLTSSNFLNYLDEILDDKQTITQYLTIELTETALIHNAETVEDTLRQLRSRGIKIALDDFGTGFSSLSHLHCFPLDIIKIDRSFVLSLFQNERSGHIVRSIIFMSQQMDLTFIAEGIEDIESLRWLQKAARMCRSSLPTQSVEVSEGNSGGAAKQQIVPKEQLGGKCLRAPHDWDASRPHCQLGQGYFWSPSLVPTAATDLLLDSIKARSR